MIQNPSNVRMLNQKLMDGESHILFFQFFSSAGLMEKNLNFQNFSTPL
jgi:hypothetical protein